MIGKEGHHGLVNEAFDYVAATKDRKARYQTGKLSINQLLITLRFGHRLTILEEQRAFYEFRCR
jgi:hypothetical protein